MAKRTHRELWNKLVDEAGEDAIERAVRLDDAQVERELEAGGFDLDAERARGEAFLDDPTEHGELRRMAIEACNDGSWDQCLAYLDAAAKLDPAGDAAPKVQRTRERAVRGKAERG